ncbi:MAG: phosphate ABC transporter permease subunit PstC [Candidatus Heimdallarchaeota archaeon]|nr:phosphate ABC transporter permease subunit PstC [Candidatus Heimdallarchaeota archaeon]
MSNKKNAINSTIPIENINENNGGSETTNGSVVKQKDNIIELEILNIGKQKISWQRIVLLLLASISIIILLMIFIFILANGIQIIPDLMNQYLAENPDKSKFVAFWISLIDFLFRNKWRPAGGEFGIAHGIVGTLLVVIVAMLISVPISIACAIFMAEIAPLQIRAILKPTIELLASIPSIVYGFFGLFTFVPAIKYFFNLDFMVKILGTALPTGETALSGGIILAIMVIPTIVSITDDSLRAVPHSYREGSFALGATRWQTVSKIVVPASISGIFAATILAFGRAIGETMAVLMIAGGSPNIPTPFFDILEPVDPLTAIIARELGEAANGSMPFHAIFATAIVLFSITFFVNIIGNVIIKRYSRKLKGD